MINVKELMIGDLVNYRPGWINEETNQVEYECGTGFPVRIEMLYYSHGEGLVQYNDGENDGIEAAEYELFPIQITPQILEKNGFRKLVTYGTEKWVCNNFRLKVYDSRGTWRFCADTNRNEDSVIYIRFIHQLQHVLRLCGIEKQINL